MRHIGTEKNMSQKNMEKHVRRTACDLPLSPALSRPEGKIDVVLDTDTFNEADDQFALSYLVKSGGNLNVRGLFAAPFFNSRVSSPKEGMEKSFDEILKLLSLLGREDLFACTRRGSDRYLPSETEPVVSDAANAMIELAMEHTAEKPLYIVNIACLTNLASALLKRPEIRDRIVVLWLGGHSLEWQDTREFNLFQDVAAARVVLSSGAPVILFPCMGVVSAFSISGPELDRWLKGKNALCDHLVKGVEDYVAARFGETEIWTKAIWDVVPVGWLKGDFTLDRIEACPLPSYDFKWTFGECRHPLRYAYHVRRDLLMKDLLQTLTGP